jgi:hypothetical protein
MQSGLGIFDTFRKTTFATLRHPSPSSLTARRVGLTSGAQRLFLLIRPALAASPADFDLAGSPAAHHLILFQAVRSNLVAAIDLSLPVPSAHLPSSRLCWNLPVLSHIRTTTPSKSSLSV